MIKIKDFIFNENEIVYINEFDAETLGIMLKGRDKCIFVDAHIEDIELNYGSQDNQDVASKYLVDRLKMLEEACIKMQSSLIRLREENERLKRK